MAGYVSVERNMRGFTYQRDWNRVAGFWRAMEHQRDNENDEVNWAKCFDEHGEEVAYYRRGFEIPKPTP